MKLELFNLLYVDEWRPRRLNCFGDGGSGDGSGGGSDSAAAAAAASDAGATAGGWDSGSAAQAASDAMAGVSAVGGTGFAGFDAGNAWAGAPSGTDAISGSISGDLGGTMAAPGGWSSGDAWAAASQAMAGESNVGGIGGYSGWGGWGGGPEGPGVSGAGPGGWDGTGFAGGPFSGGFDNSWGGTLGGPGGFEGIGGMPGWASGLFGSGLDIASVPSLASDPFVSGTPGIGYPGVGGLGPNGWSDALTGANPYSGLFGGLLGGAPQTGWGPVGPGDPQWAGVGNTTLGNALTGAAIGAIPGAVIGTGLGGPFGTIAGTLAGAVHGGILGAAIGPVGDPNNPGGPLSGFGTYAPAPTGQFAAPETQTTQTENTPNTISFQMAPATPQDIAVTQTQGVTLPGGPETSTANVGAPSVDEAGMASGAAAMAAATAAAASAAPSGGTETGAATETGGGPQGGGPQGGGPQSGSPQGGATTGAPDTATAPADLGVSPDVGVTPGGAAPQGTATPSGGMEGALGAPAAPSLPGPMATTAPVQFAPTNALPGPLGGGVGVPAGVAPGVNAPMGPSGGGAGQLGGNVDQAQGRLGATRSQAISGRLGNVLQQAGRAAGVNVTVKSGGQPSTGKGRVGSHRHDQGNAADVSLTDARDGHTLSMNNPQDRAKMATFAKAASAAGATGIGAGESYMGAQTMHVGFGKEATWGAKGQSSQAPGWLSQATAQGRAARGTNTAAAAAAAGAGAATMPAESEAPAPAPGRGHGRAGRGARGQARAARGQPRYTGAQYSPGLAQSRAQQIQEIRNSPELQDNFRTILQGEAGNLGPAGQVAIMETVLNRASARGWSLARATNPTTRGNNYFARGTFRGGQASNQTLNSVLDEVARGSNTTGYATGNASGHVGVGHTTHSVTVGRNTERFGIENQTADRGWAGRAQQADRGAPTTGYGFTEPAPTTPLAPTAPVPYAPVAPTAPMPAPAPTPQTMIPPMPNTPHARQTGEKNAQQAVQSYMDVFGPPPGLSGPLGGAPEGQISGPETPSNLSPQSVVGGTATAPGIEAPAPAPGPQSSLGAGLGSMLGIGAAQAAEAPGIAEFNALGKSMIANTPPDQRGRAQDMFSRMTTQDKLNLLSGKTTLIDIIARQNNVSRGAIETFASKDQLGFIARAQSQIDSLGRDLAGKAAQEKAAQQPAPTPQSPIPEAPTSTLFAPPPAPELSPNQLVAQDFAQLGQLGMPSWAQSVGLAPSPAPEMSPNQVVAQDFNALAGQPSWSETAGQPQAPTAPAQEAVQEAGRDAQANPEAAQQIASAYPEAVANLAAAYFIDEATAAMMLLRMHPPDFPPARAADGGRIEVPLPRPRRRVDPRPDDIYYMPDYPNFNDEAWTQAVESWPMSENIEDRRFNDPTKSVPEAAVSYANPIYMPRGLPGQSVLRPGQQWPEPGQAKGGRVKFDEEGTYIPFNYPNFNEEAWQQHVEAMPLSENIEDRRFFDPTWHPAETLWGTTGRFQIPPAEQWPETPTGYDE